MGSSKQIEEQIKEIKKSFKYLKIMCSGDILMNETNESIILDSLKDLESYSQDIIKEIKVKLK